MAKVLVQERDKLENERATKRRHLLHINCDSVDSQGEESYGSNGVDGNNGDKSLALEQETMMLGTKPPQLPPGYNIWWDSMLAQKLFNTSKEKETAVDQLEDLIAVLDNANLMALS
jgi:hypothetical protein